MVKAIADALSHVNDPEIKRPITDLNMIDEITVDEQGRAFDPYRPLPGSGTRATAPARTSFDDGLSDHRLRP